MTRANGSAPWLGVAAAFALLVGFGAFPWPEVRYGFSAAVGAALNPLLAHMEFGKGGHVQLRPAASATRGDVDARGSALAHRGADDSHADAARTDEVTSDTEICISVSGFSGELVFGQNLRRDLYLPFLVFMALALALPGALGTRLACLFLGTPLLLLWAGLAELLTIVWIFATQVSSIYPLSAMTFAVLDWAVRSFLMPPGVRMIAPILLTALVVQLQGRRFVSELRQGRAPIFAPDT